MAPCLPVGTAPTCRHWPGNLGPVSSVLFCCGPGVPGRAGLSHHATFIRQDHDGPGRKRL